MNLQHNWGLWVEFDYLKYFPFMLAIYTRSRYKSFGIALGRSINQTMYESLAFSKSILKNSYHILRVYIHYSYQMKTYLYWAYQFQKKNTDLPSLAAADVFIHSWNRKSYRLYHVSPSFPNSVKRGASYKTILFQTNNNKMLVKEKFVITIKLKTDNFFMNWFSILKAETATSKFWFHLITLQIFINKNRLIDKVDLGLSVVWNVIQGSL